MANPMQVLPSVFHKPSVSPRPGGGPAELLTNP
jgi:hypothetical protein